MSRASICPLLVILTTLPVFACGGDGDETQREELLAVDREFAQASVQFGAPQAFYMYMADEAVWLPNESDRRIGPESIRDALAEIRGLTLDWAPLDGDVSVSGDLGYTWGTWEATVADVETGGASVSTGRYVTVWRRDPDGSWRAVLDMGNREAPPASEESDEQEAGP
jgi:ketosteroid isomerase-like protein